MSKILRVWSNVFLGTGVSSPVHLGIEECRRNARETPTVAHVQTSDVVGHQTL